MNTRLTWDEMVKKTKEFYQELGVEIRDNDISLAVQSLTMPCYAKEYNDKNIDKNLGILDHRSLGTVGDAVNEGLLMIRKFKSDSTMESLTNDKVELTNENLNRKGKELLEKYLFNINNDLDPKNKKSFATAFEAIIGFLSLIRIDKAKEVFDKYIE